MIDHFTCEQFEAALPRHKTTQAPLWSLVGVVDGEYAYVLTIDVSDSDDQVGIMIRSSVRPNGQSAGTGEDSIRCWLVSRELTYDSAGSGEKIIAMGEWQSIGAKVNRYTTRLPGWQVRLTANLRTLWQWRKKAGDCEKCGRPKHVAKSGKPESKNRVFAKCFDCNTGFVWLTEELVG